MMYVAKTITEIQIVAMVVMFFIANSIISIVMVYLVDILKDMHGKFFSEYNIFIFFAFLYSIVFFLFACIFYTLLG